MEPEVVEFLKRISTSIFVKLYNSKGFKAAIEMQISNTNSQAVCSVRKIFFRPAALLLLRFSCTVYPARRGTLVQQNRFQQLAASFREYNLL